MEHLTYCLTVQSAAQTRNNALGLRHYGFAFRRTIRIAGQAHRRKDPIASLSESRPLPFPHAVIA